MTKTPKISLTDHLNEVEDPRIDRTKRHQLLDIIVIAICAIICGADEVLLKGYPVANLLASLERLLFSSEI